VLRRLVYCASLVTPLALSACSDSSDGDDVDDTLNSGADSGAEADDDSTPDDVATPDDDSTPDDLAPADDDNVDFGPGAVPTVAEPEPVLPEPEPAPVNTDLPNALDPLVACPGAVGTGTNPMIDDFEDLDGNTLVVDGREASWYSYDDLSAGGSLLLEWIATDAPAQSGSGVMHIVGQGFPQYSGIGTGLRWTETGAEFCYYDASYYDGVAFWAKGNSSMRVALQNPSIRPVAEGGTCPADAACYDSHGMDIELTEEWTYYVVGFGAVEQAGWGTPVGAFLPSELFTVEFQFPPGGTYDITIDDFGFYEEGDPLPEPEPTPEPVVEPGDAGPVLDAGSEEDVDGGVPTDLDAGAEPWDATLPAADAAP
jgi:hypothetical protein